MAVKQKHERSFTADGQSEAVIALGQPEAKAARKIPVLSAFNSISYLRPWKIRLGLGIIGFFVLMAIFAPLIARQDPQAFGRGVFLPQPPSAEHLLGTTQTGQDVFAQVVYGSR